MTHADSSEHGGRRLIGSALLTSVSTFAVMASGGFFAILAAWLFSSRSVTDGFFVAYAAYTIPILLAQSMRTTIVPRLAEDPRRLERFLAGSVILFGLFGVAFVIFGGAVADAFTDGRSTNGSASLALALLWPAVGAQLFAGAGCAMLAVYDDFRRPAVAYGVGSVCANVSLVSLASPLGEQALSISVTLGSIVTASIVGFALSRHGWRARLAWRAAPQSAWAILFAAIPVMLAQGIFLISIVSAKRLGEGAQTVYSYGYSAHQVVFAVLASSVATVFVAVISSDREASPLELTPHIRAAFRTGLIPLVVIVVGVAALGGSIGRLALPSRSSDEIDAMVRVFLGLVPAVVFGQAGAIPLVALFARRRYGVVVLLSAGVTALHVGMTVGLVRLGGGVGSLAVVASISSGLLAASLFVALFGRHAGRVALGLGRDFGVIFVIALACSALTAGIVAVMGGSARFGLVGGVPLVLIAASRLPEYRELFARARTGLGSQGATRA